MPTAPAIYDLESEYGRDLGWHPKDPEYWKSETSLAEAPPNSKKWFRDSRGYDSALLSGYDFVQEYSLVIATIDAIPQGNSQDQDATNDIKFVFKNLAEQVRVLERFEGFVEEVNDDVAHVLLKSEHGDLLAGQYSADQLASLGINEGDRFECKTVIENSSTSIQINRLNDKLEINDRLSSLLTELEREIATGSEF